LREDLVGKWFAHPEINDLLQKLDLRSDGTGSLVSGGGQGIFLEADFDWNVSEPGRLSIQFKEPVAKKWGPYRPTPETTFHAVGCSLEEGEFPIAVLAMGTVIYPRRIRFDESPLPTDAATHHATSLFFSVVNKIDPRGFLLFYPPMVGLRVLPAGGLGR
jgi:hypothetical protein